MEKENFDVVPLRILGNSSFLILLHLVQECTHRRLHGLQSLRAMAEDFSEVWVYCVLCLVIILCTCVVLRLMTYFCPRLRLLMTHRYTGMVLSYVLMPTSLGLKGINNVSTGKLSHSHNIINNPLFNVEIQVQEPCAFCLEKCCCCLCNMSILMVHFSSIFTINTACYLEDWYPCLLIHI